LIGEEGKTTEVPRKKREEKKKLRHRGAAELASAKAAIATEFQSQSLCVMSRRYDVVVWGSSGFTGRLTCEYYAKTYPNLKWAIAGRNEGVLQEIKKSLNLNSVDILVGSIDNQASLRAITSQTKVLLTTAGPYAKIGMPVVEACVATGTHYCDLTGEASFIRSVVDQYSDEA
jgi:short subunit dehydrogenase-like uncharacterized protein